MRVLIVTDGKKGHYNQSAALARALSPDFVDTFEPKFASPWSEASLRLISNLYGVIPGWRPTLPLLKRCLTGVSFIALSKLLSSSRPDAVVSSGTTTAAVNAAVSGTAKAFSVVNMRPSLVALRLFDFAVLPRHDIGKGVLPRNAVATDLAPYWFDHAKADADADTLKRSGLGVEKEFIGVCIGGASRHGDLGAFAVAELMTPLLKHCFESGMQLAVTTSRRTSAEEEEYLTNAHLTKRDVFPYLLIANKDPFNPLPAFCKIAKALVVTADSISMVSEAIHGGRRPLAVAVSATTHARTKGFYDNIVAKKYAVLVQPSGIVAGLERVINRGTEIDFDEMTRVAAELKRRYEEYKTKPCKS
jgi:mitochondrial fission protein ELM1